MLRWRQDGFQWRVIEAENLRKVVQTINAFVQFFSCAHQPELNKAEPSENLFSCSEQNREDDIALVALLKACATKKDLNRGNLLYANALKNDLIKQNIFIGNTFINMYTKCNVLAKARHVFDELPFRTLVSWTVLIIGFVEQGHCERALACYDEMVNDGHTPDGITLAGLLKACGSTGSVDKGKLIHAMILREGLLIKYIKLGSALVGMYAKFGVLLKAREVFEELPVQNLVAWTTIIGAYSQHEHGKEALICFEIMKDKGFTPDAMTFSCILKACGILGATMKGQEIHAEIARMCSLDGDVILASALVDMYSKCCAVTKAQEVFQKLSMHDTGTWTSLITGYNQVGKHSNVLDAFNRMLQEGVRPNSVTFLIVLNACCSLNLVDKGQLLFHFMSELYGIAPTLEHHTCLVGLFGCAGDFKQASEKIKKMPFSNFLQPWLAFLAACQKWGNVNHAQVAFNNVVKLDKKSAIAYICMGKIYAAAGLHHDLDDQSRENRE